MCLARKLSLYFIKRVFDEIKYYYYIIIIIYFVSQMDPSRENLFVVGSKLYRLGLRHKVQLLHALCDFRLEAEDVLDLLKVSSNNNHLLTI